MKKFYSISLLFLLCFMLQAKAQTANPDFKFVTTGGQEIENGATIKSNNVIDDPYAESGKILYHKVANGETLESIAKQHGITLDQICRLNRLGRFTRVVEGQLLTISK